MEDRCLHVYLLDCEYEAGDFSCGLLLATNYPTDYYNAGYLPAADCMVVNRIHFTPEDTSQGTIQTGE